MDSTCRGVTLPKPQSLGQKLANAPAILTGIEGKTKPTRLFPGFVAKVTALIMYSKIFAILARDFQIFPNALKLLETRMFNNHVREKRNNCF